MERHVDGPPRLLDLFCGAGGAAAGYFRAGFHVTGVDLAPQPRFPLAFFQADALEYLTAHGERFDAVHASPPCQAYSVTAARTGLDYPRLIEPVRRLLVELGRPYVIENVIGAPLHEPLLLCGSMFDLRAGERQLRRHRLFECSFPVVQPSCVHEGQSLGVYGGGTTYRESGARHGGYQGTVVERQEAMGAAWMVREEINEAIPPAYTQFIGRALLAHLGR